MPLTIESAISICPGHNAKGYRYKLRNRRVIVGYCAKCDEWLVKFRRLPTVQERAEGKRTADIAFHLTGEAMAAMQMIAVKVMEEVEKRESPDEA